MSEERDTWRLLWSWTAGVRRPLVVSWVFAASWAASIAVFPWVLERAIEDGIRPGDAAVTTRLGLAMVALGVAAGWLRWRWLLLSYRASARAEANLRARAVERVTRVDVDFHDRTPPGRLMALINTDITQVEVVGLWMGDLVIGVVTLAIAGTLLVTVDFWLALAALGGAPVLSYLGFRAARSMRPAASDLQQELRGLSALVEDTLGGILVIKGLGGERAQQLRMLGSVDRIYYRSMHWARLRALVTPAFDLVLLLSLAALLIVGAQRVSAGVVSLGEVSAAATYVALLVGPLSSLGLAVAAIARGFASAERIGEVLAEPLPRATVGRRAQSGAVSPVRFDAVSFAYPSRANRDVLRQFELTVEPGATVALVGATGAGKSTAAQLLAGLYAPTAGRVLLGGTEVRAIPSERRRRLVGLVMQEPVLFTRSISENLTLGVPDADAREVVAACRAAGAHDFISALPDGYATVVGERGYSLSGGQRQRIGLARALIAAPDVLVLDDATSAVDAETELRIISALVEARADQCTIMIAYRTTTLTAADEVALLVTGRIAARGPHVELLADERYRAVLGLVAA